MKEHPWNKFLRKESKPGKKVPTEKAVDRFVDVIEWQLKRIEKRAEERKKYG